MSFLCYLSMLYRKFKIQILVYHRTYKIQMADFHVLTDATYKAAGGIPSST